MCKGLLQRVKSFYDNIFVWREGKNGPKRVQSIAP